MILNFHHIVFVLFFLLITLSIYYNNYINISISIKNNYLYLYVYLLVILFIWIFFFLNNPLYFNSLYIKNCLIDGFSIKLIFIFLLFSILCIIYIIKVQKRLFQQKDEFFLLYIISLICSIFIFFLNDLLLLYLLLETFSFCQYILVSIDKKNYNTILSGIRYFIISSVNSFFFLFGFSFIYLDTGFFSFDDYYYYYYSIEYISNISMIGLVLIFISIAIKCYLTPFHFWITTIYPNINISSLLVITTVPNIVYIYIFYKFFIIFQLFNNNFFYILLCCFSIMSILIGSTSGLIQQEIKSILVYSSIINNGYAFLFFCNGTKYINYIFIYLAFYNLSILLFLNLISLLYTKKNKELVNMIDLTNLYLNHPQFSLLLSISIFILSGLPPFFTFITKVFLIFSLLEDSNLFFSIIVLFSICINLYFYLKLIKTINFINFSFHNKIKIVYSYTNIFFLILILILFILLFFYINTLYTFFFIPSF